MELRRLTKLGTSTHSEQVNEIFEAPATRLDGIVGAPDGLRSLRDSSHEVVRVRCVTRPIRHCQQVAIRTSRRADGAFS